MRVGVVEETAGFSRDSSYRAHNRLWTHTDPPTVGFSNRVTAEKAKEAYGEKVK